MADNRELRDVWKTIGLWLALLCFVGAVQYLASGSTNVWQSVPWMVVVISALVYVVARRPLPPELEEEVRRLAEERSVCKRCGATNAANDIFCGVCHRSWERAIALVLFLGIVWVVYLLWDVRPK